MQYGVEYAAGSGSGGGCGDEAFVCICDTACTESSRNPDCPVCGAEGAHLHDCALYEDAHEPETEDEEPFEEEEPEEEEEPSEEDPSEEEEQEPEEEKPGESLRKRTPRRSPKIRNNRRTSPRMRAKTANPRTKKVLTMRWIRSS